MAAILGQLEAAVHNNSSLSKIDKFNYLKSLVEGNKCCLSH